MTYPKEAIQKLARLLDGDVSALNWLADKGYTGNGTPPKIPDEIRIEAAKRYISAYENITGEDFKAESGDPISRITKNLRKRGYLDG